MHQFSYADFVEDDPRLARKREEQAFDHAIGLMRLAGTGGPQTAECRDALFFLDRFWTILMDDLSHPDNDLPDPLRASLISIGIWILKQVDAMRQGRLTSFASLIEINGIVRDGLR